MKALFKERVSMDVSKRDESSLYFLNVKHGALWNCYISFTQVFTDIKRAKKHALLKGKSLLWEVVASAHWLKICKRSTVSLEMSKRDMWRLQYRLGMGDWNQELPSLPFRPVTHIVYFILFDGVKKLFLPQSELCNFYICSCCAR